MLSFYGNTNQMWLFKITWIFISYHLYPFNVSLSRRKKIKKHKKRKGKERKKLKNLLINIFLCIKISCLKNFLLKITLLSWFSFLMFKLLNYWKIEWSVCTINLHSRGKLIYKIWLLFIKDIRKSFFQ